jgi:hypothetical protein
MTTNEDTGMTNEDVAHALRDSLAPLGIVPMEDELANEPPIGGLRRRRSSRFDDEVGVVTLLDIDGVLVWEDGAVSPSTSAVRRRRAGTAADGDVVTQLKYSKALGTNRINAQLEAFDARLTPQGPSKLLEWDSTTWTSHEVDRPAESGKILLFVHGTFSNSENLIAELWKPDKPGQGPGADFLRKAAAEYSQILSFDHYTVSRSPIINAIELARLFDGSHPERLDVICHSRGGLVTRWWCEVLDRRPRPERRVVFVGCPLEGTSLADPESLRNGINLLSNAGRTLGKACRLIPMLTVAGGLMQILSSLTSLAARAPIIDAGVAMIPGLAAMSRIGNNSEIKTLNAVAVPTNSKYFAITSDFEPDPVMWRFWRLFTRKRAADLAADYLVFNQANDLVVDTSSMTHHAWGKNPDVRNKPDVFRCFDPADGVHHTNYFTQRGTVAFLEECLGL